MIVLQPRVFLILILVLVLSQTMSKMTCDHVWWCWLLGQVPASPLVQISMMPEKMTQRKEMRRPTDVNADCRPTSSPFSHLKAALAQGPDTDGDSWDFLEGDADAEADGKSCCKRWCCLFLRWPLPNSDFPVAPLSNISHSLFFIFLLSQTFFECF